MYAPLDLHFLTHIALWRSGENTPSIVRILQRKDGKQRSKQSGGVRMKLWCSMKLDCTCFTCMDYFKCLFKLNTSWNWMSCCPHLVISVTDWDLCAGTSSSSHGLHCHLHIIFIDAKRVTSALSALEELDLECSSKGELLQCACASNVTQCARGREEPYLLSYVIIPLCINTPLLRPLSWWSFKCTVECSKQYYT